MKEKIMVLVKEPRRKAELREIDNRLRTLQEIVGGYIETVALSDGGILICDEEGLVKGTVPFNMRVEGHMIFGTFIVCGSDGEAFTDVPLQCAARFLGG